MANPSIVLNIQWNAWTLPPSAPARAETAPDRSEGCSIIFAHASAVYENMARYLAMRNLPE